MVQRRVTVWEAVTSLDSWHVWYVVRKDVGPPVPRCHRCAQSRGSLPQAHGGGPPAHVPALVPGRVPLFQANRGNAPAPASPVVPGLVFGPLGKALPSKGSRVSSGRQTAWVWCPLSWHGNSVKDLLLVLVLVFAIRRLVLLVLGKEHMAALHSRSWSITRPSHVSLLSALGFIVEWEHFTGFSRIRQTEKRCWADSLLLVQPLESTND